MDINQMNAVLAKITRVATVEYTKNAKVRIGKSIVHFRYCSSRPGARWKFKFSINPNTLSADYELWICGNAAVYYLIPISFMKDIYDNPDTYADRKHPEVRPVNVDTYSHAVTYAKGGVKKSLKPYLCATLS
jgi:hypothetical protein